MSESISIPEEETRHIFLAYVSTPYTPVGVCITDSGQIVPKSELITVI
jgi:hypothetical protein